MKSGHVPDDLLSAFVEGDVNEQVAVHIAEHLDACPACATRAVTLEPLAAVFAAVEDPVPPPDLHAAILTEVDRPERGPSIEVGVGAALLAAAALLTLVGGRPASALVEIGRLLDGVSRLGSHVPGDDLAPILLLLLLSCAAVVVWVARGERGEGALDPWRTP